MSACDDETACQFVSSRGLLKSCQVRPMNPKSSCPSQLEYVADFIVSQNNYARNRDHDHEAPPSPVSIYVCCDAFQTFIQEYAPHINVSYVVVCGDGDLTMFREAVQPNKVNQFVMFVLNPNMRGLFSQNMDIQDCRVFLKEKITKLWNANASVFKADNAPQSLEMAIQAAQNKLKQIPIGMDYHTIRANPSHPWVAHSSSSTEAGMTKPVEQERILVENIRARMNPFYQRKIRIYSNVILCPDRFNDRISAVSTIPRGLISQQTGFIPRTQTWLNMLEYAFVLSPFGNGMDCHRTWEALLCGCIPIVRSSVFNELFDGLPVLIVDKWEDISLCLLVDTVAQFKEKMDNNEYNYDKLRLSYYTKMFVSKSTD
jgi:hypothetical protein